MSWKFPTSFLSNGSEQNQGSDIPTQSWYPPSVVGSSPSSSRPGSSPAVNVHPRTSDHLQSPYGNSSPSEAAGVINKLKDKSVDELRKLLTDKNAYNSFFASLDQVKDQNSFFDDLHKQTLQLARENLGKEPQILELRNQCQIIRTSELATAEEALTKLEKEKEEILKFYSPRLLLQKLQDAIDSVDEESEMLHRQFLDNQVDISSFVQRYKKLRMIHHKRALIHLAAKTNAI